MVALKSADIEAFLAKPDPARPIALIFGPDAGLVRERVGQVLKASVDDFGDPFSLVRLAGDDLAADPQRLADEALTIPLFGSRRAVWVKAGSKNFTAALEPLFAGNAVRDCRIIIEAGDLKRNAPLRTACERAKTVVCIPCYADSERDLARLVDDEIRRANTSISQEAKAILLPLLGGDRQATRNELAKLLLYARGKSMIEAEDVLAVVADAASLALDGLVDAAFAGNGKEADTQYGKARAAGSPPGTILAAALRQVAQLHLLALAVGEGTPVSSAVERSQFAMNFRRRKSIETALRLWTPDRLRRAMAHLADATRDSRLQTLLADSIAQRTLLSIARAAGNNV